MTAGHEGFVDLDTGDGVEGGIGELTGIELVGLPVGETLALAELEPEEKGVDLGKTEVDDAIGLDQLLQFDEALGFELLVPLAQVLEIVLGGEAHLHHIGILEQRLQTIGELLYLVEPEKIAHLSDRKLHQANTIGHALLERGTCLGVEPDNLARFAYLAHGDLGLFEVDDRHRMPGELLGREVGKFLFAD